MRIGLVLPAAPAYSETFFRSKIKGLIASGLVPIVFTSERKSDFDLCKTIPLGLSNSKFLKAFQITARFFSAIIAKPRVCLRILNYNDLNGISSLQSLKTIAINSKLIREDLHWIHFGFATMAINREVIARAKRIKSAVSLRGYDVCIFPLSKKTVYKKLWSELDKVHTISDDLILKAYDLGLEKNTEVMKINPAIDLNKFKYQPKSIESEKVEILTVARLHWKKGLEDSLAALRQAKSMGLNFRYTVAGEGDELERLMYATHQLGLQNEVQFLGRVEHNEIIELLANSDIYLQYSISEGFCNSVLEAQAVGTLCVVSDGEGLTENILHGKTGWVVPRFSERILAQTLVEISNLENGTKDEVRQNARKRVEKCFNINDQNNQFKEFYLN